MSLLSPLGGSGRPRKGDFMRSPLILPLLAIDEEDEDCCFVVVVAAAGGGGFPGALTTCQTDQHRNTESETVARTRGLGVGGYN